MFASGMGPLSVAAFALSTMFIAVPTGVKILNWLYTMWGGKLKFTTPMLFAIGLVTMFTIGGLSGVTAAVASTPSRPTYYIVAHFHYVIFGGALLGFLGGMYFWWPKVFEYLLNEKLGKWRWTILIGFNLTFRADARPRPAGHAPPHAHLRRGLPVRLLEHGVDRRRVHHRGVDAHAGGTSSPAGGAGRPVGPGPDPWDARSLEWMVQSPVPAHNFDTVPTVSHLDEFWHRKYPRRTTRPPRRVALGAPRSPTG